MKPLILITAFFLLVISTNAQRGAPIKDLTLESIKVIDSLNKSGNPHYDTMDCKRTYDSEICVATLTYKKTSEGFYNVLKVLHNEEVLVTIYQTPEVIQEVIFDCQCRDGRVIAIINDPRLKLSIISYMDVFEEIVADNFFAHKFSFFYTLRYDNKALKGEYYRYGSDNFRRRDIVD